MLIVLLISLFQLITCNNEKIQFDVNDHIAHNQSPNILSNFINDKNSYNSSVRSIPLNHQLSSELIPSFNKITFPHYRFYLLSNLELNNRYELRLCFPAIHQADLEFQVVNKNTLVHLLSNAAFNDKTEFLNNISDTLNLSLELTYLSIIEFKPSVLYNPSYVNKDVNFEFNLILETLYFKALTKGLIKLIIYIAVSLLLTYFVAIKQFKAILLTNNKEKTC